MRSSSLTICAVVLMFALCAVPAHASLTSLASFTGTVGVSTAGCGSTAQSCTLTAHIPVGATILAAYLWQANFDGPSGTFGGTLGGSPLVFGPPSDNTSATYLESDRANVTALLTSRQPANVTG